jgi:hypothetical protein
VRERFLRRYIFVFFMLAKLLLKFIHSGLNFVDVLPGIMAELTHLLVLLFVHILLCFKQFRIALSKGSSHVLQAHCVCRVFEKTSDR